MSNTWIEGHLAHTNGVASEAAELFNGESCPKNGDVPALMSPEYMQERWALSCVLVTAAVNEVVIEDGSMLGYSFTEQPPDTITDHQGMQGWVQTVCHKALDSAIDTSPSMHAVSQRYQDLIVPTKRRGQAPSAQDRRETLQFNGAVFDPYAWLSIGNIAAKYNGKSIAPEQAMPYVLSKLSVIQQSAHRDVAVQTIRSAVVGAAIGLGELHSPGDPADRDKRYELLKQYVAKKSGHLLVGKRFGNLYKVVDDPTIGVTVTERPEGFGKIKPVRQTPLGCPAAYRIQQSPERNEKSALFRLLRACIGTMNERDIFQTALQIPRTEIPEALKKLS